MIVKSAIMLFCLLVWAVGDLAQGDALRRDLTPESVSDLEAIEKEVKRVLPAALKSLVSVQSEKFQGSGVLISSDGTVYTAAHVVLPVNGSRQCMIILPSGKEIEGCLVIEDEETDAAIVKIPAMKGKFPVIANGMPSVGEWVFALGHAGGYDSERGAVVRLGRVVSVKDGVVQTDCKLIKGDSGGGLFNLKGELVGIHSKVGAGLDDNVHLPVSVFRTITKRR